MAEDAEKEKKWLVLAGAERAVSSDGQTRAGQLVIEIDPAQLQAYVDRALANKNGRYVIDRKGAVTVRVLATGEPLALREFLILNNGRPVDDDDDGGDDGEDAGENEYTADGESRDGEEN